MIQTGNSFLKRHLKNFGNFVQGIGVRVLVAQNLKDTTPSRDLTMRYLTLQWRHNERDGVSSHWRLDCLLNRLFKHRSKKTSKLRFIGLCEENPPVNGGFPSQRAIYVCLDMFHSDIYLHFLSLLYFHLPSTRHKTLCFYLPCFIFYFCLPCFIFSSQIAFYWNKHFVSHILYT